MESSTMKITLDSGRVAALFLLVFALLFAWSGSRIEYAFASDPLGPRAFPLLLAGALAVFSIWLFFRPGESEAWPRGRILWKGLGIPLCVALAALLLMPIGFFAVTFLLVTVIAWIFDAGLRRALISGVLQAALWQLVFVHLLGVYLPSGSLWGGLLP
jgi:putative tricarboxylic transport membrane protein